MIESPPNPATKVQLSETLLKALPLIAGNVNSTTTVPILSNLLIEAKNGWLFARSTDLETAVVYSEPCLAGLEFAVTLNAKQVASLTKGAKNVVLTVLGALKASLLIDGASIDLNALPAEDYPPIPADAFNHAGAISMSQRELHDMLTRVSAFASSEEARGAVLMGTYIEITRAEANRPTKVSFTSTDGFRLGQFARMGTAFTAIPTDTSFILPEAGKVAKLLGKIKPAKGKDVELTLFYGCGRNGNLSFIRTHLGDFGMLEIIVRNVDGQYPNYRQVIPTDYDPARSFVANVEAFQKVLSQAAKITSRAAANTVTLELTPDYYNPTLAIRAQDEEAGTFEGMVDCHTSKHSASPITVGFNGKYLGDCIKSGIVGDRFEVRFTSPLSPAKIIDFGDGETLIVLMPLRP